MNTVRTETMIARSFSLLRISARPMRHQSHPMKAWRHTSPMMMTMTSVNMRREVSGTEDESSITTKNIFEEEIDPETTFINTQHPRYGNSSKISWKCFSWRVNGRSR